MKLYRVAVTGRTFNETFYIEQENASQAIIKVLTKENANKKSKVDFKAPYIEVACTEVTEVNKIIK